MKSFGFRAIHFTGDLLRDNTATAEFIREIKATLPPDAAVYSMDGLLYRMLSTTRGYAVDQFVVVFGSSEWEQLPAGSLFPVMTIHLHNEAPQNEEYPKMIELHRIWSVGAYEIVIDKKTQQFDVPRERETEDYAVIVIKNK